jgi:DNA-directed RNA polymerase III subunit RPC11
MLSFCPSCANMLVVEADEKSRNTLRCPTCPYAYPLERTAVAFEVPTERKHAEDVLGGEKAWRNVESTNAACPRCDNETAYFRQVQTRSADEPMTTFFRFASRWRLLELASADDFTVDPLSSLQVHQVRQPVARLIGPTVTARGES